MTMRFNEGKTNTIHSHAGYTEIPRESAHKPTSSPLSDILVTFKSLASVEEWGS